MPTPIEARRLTVNLRASDVARIEAIAEQTGLTANEILRRALATEEFVQRNRREGRKILVENDDKSLREIEFLY